MMLESSAYHDYHRPMTISRDFHKLLTGIWWLTSKPIEELYSDDCVLDVPTGVFVGEDALDKFAGDLRATHPHFVYTPHGADHQAQYDKRTKRAYVEFRRTDSDGSDQLVVAVFTFHTKERLSKQRIREEVVRKARHVLKGAVLAA